MRAILERLVMAILVLLGGSEALDSDWGTAALALAAVLGDIAVRYCRKRDGIAAVNEATAHPSTSTPSGNADLVRALERAGISVEEVEKAWRDSVGQGKCGEAEDAGQESGPGDADVPGEGDGDEAGGADDGRGDATV